MDRTSHPQYSPDGKWWWDGARWTEVTPDWPPRGGAPLVAPPAEESPPPAHPSIVRPLMMAIGAAMAVVVLGTGAVWAWQHRPAVGLPALPTPAPSAGQAQSPTPSPSSLPEEKYPYRYMTNLRVSDITNRLEQQGFACRQPQPLGDLGLVEWHCDRNANNVTYSFTSEARSETKVHQISAIAIGTSDKPALGDVKALFDLLAGLPFSKQPDVATQARSWVRDNADKDANQTFGQITFGTLPGDKDYFLEMDAGFTK
jgi:hypothetical protein